MSNKLYVGNLPFSVTEESLSGTFSAYGTIESCKIISDRDTGRSKGFGFVEMSNEEEAQNVISELDGTELEGRQLRISIAKPQEKRSFSSPRGGGGGRRW